MFLEEWKCKIKEKGIKTLMADDLESSSRKTPRRKKCWVISNDVPVLFCDRQVLLFHKIKSHKEMCVSRLT